MIEITVYKKGEDIVTIEATGHSGYKESGSDIYCSAVSTLTQTCEIGLSEVLNIRTKYVVDEKRPFLSITLPDNLEDKEMREAQIVMQTAFLGLKSLRDSEPKYISIKEKRR